MERVFSQCTRIHDMLESQGRHEGFRGHREWFRGFRDMFRSRREIYQGLNPLDVSTGRHNSPSLSPGEIFQELNLDVSTEEFLSAEKGFTYADLYAMLGDGEAIAWLTPHTAVARKGRSAVHTWVKLYDSCCFPFNVDGKDIVALARSPEHLLEIRDVVLRLLAASVVNSVLLAGWTLSDGFALFNASPPLPSSSLAYIMEQCQSLKALTLQNVNALDEDQIRVLGTCSRPGLEIELIRCELTRAGTSALAEVLGRNQGPTNLYLCDIDYSILANGLRENSSLKSLRPSLSCDRGVGNQELLAIAGILRESKGLVGLDLRCYDFMMSGEAWGAICDSLETHPTLQVLTFGWAPLAPAVLKFLVKALVDMLKVNTSIHTICLLDTDHPHRYYNEHELFRRSITPYLEMNRLRPRLLAIQKTHPIAYRAKVLGRALLSVRTDANRFWMLLSGNPEVAFSSMTATPLRLRTSQRLIMLLLLLPRLGKTPTREVSTTGGASSAANVAPPTADQKRKARP
jgi:hypothetical protein